MGRGISELDVVGLIASLAADGVAATNGGGLVLRGGWRDKVIVNVDNGIGRYNAREDVEKRSVSRQGGRCAGLRWKHRGW